MAAKKKAHKPTMAIHAYNDDKTEHLVGIGNLRVVIVPDGDLFFAQALEIDYAEQGKTLDDVKKNFERGITLTIEQHLKVNGSIDGLLKQAPPEYWKQIIGDPSADRNYFSCVTYHQLVSEQTPFKGIEYLIARGATQAAQANA